VRMHGPTSPVATTELKAARPQGKRCRSRSNELRSFNLILHA
jgi:hypothetical protein